MDLNNLEGISSLINNLTDGAGIEGLGDISKLAKMIDVKGLFNIGSKIPLILVIILLALFGNRRSCCTNNPQYICCCSKKKHCKHRKRRYCCCYGGYKGYGGYSNCGNYGGYSSCGGYRGFGNIIFIIILLLLVRCGKRDCLTSTCDNDNNIFNFDASDNTRKEANVVEYSEANEEE